MHTLFSISPPTPWLLPAIDVLIAATADQSAAISSPISSESAQLVILLCNVTSPTDYPLAYDQFLAGGSFVTFSQWVRRLLTLSDAAGYSDFVGDTVIVTQTIPVHGLGRVHYRGTEWSARTMTGKTHKPGDGATIHRVEGIILVVG